MDADIDFMPGELPGGGGMDVETGSGFDADMLSPRFAAVEDDVEIVDADGDQSYIDDAEMTVDGADEVPEEAEAEMREVANVDTVQPLTLTEQHDAAGNEVVLPATSFATHLPVQENQSGLLEHPDDGDHADQEPAQDEQEKAPSIAQQEAIIDTEGGEVARNAQQVDVAAAGVEVGDEKSGTPEALPHEDHGEVAQDDVTTEADAVASSSVQAAQSPDVTVVNGDRTTSDLQPKNVVKLMNRDDDCASNTASSGSLTRPTPQKHLIQDIEFGSQISKYFRHSKGREASTPPASNSSQLDVDNDADHNETAYNHQYQPDSKPHLRAPPIQLTFENVTYDLFNTPDDSITQTTALGDGDNDTSDLLLGEKDDHAFYFYHLESLCHRLHDIFPEFDNAHEEMVLVFQELSMRIPEDNVYTRELSLYDLDRLHMGARLPGRLHIHLEKQARLIHRFNVLADFVHNLQTPSDNQEEEDGDEEEEVEGDEDAEGEVEEGVEQIIVPTQDRDDGNEHLHNDAENDPDNGNSRNSTGQESEADLVNGTRADAELTTQLNSTLDSSTEESTHVPHAENGREGVVPSSVEATAIDPVPTPTPQTVLSETLKQELTLASIPPTPDGYEAIDYDEPYLETSTSSTLPFTSSTETTEAVKQASTIPASPSKKRSQDVRPLDEEEDQGVEDSQELTSVTDQDRSQGEAKRARHL